eukprot:PITA_09304
MGSKAKEEAMNSLIRLEAPDILLIQETKLEDSAFLQASRKFWKKDGAHATSARGASGGLGSLWNPNKFSLISESLNTHWNLLKLQHLESKEIISLVNVYAPNNAAEITNEELEKEAKLQQNFHKACLAEEEYWRLNSRSLWLKSGDRNSSFFHKQAQARKGRNSITEIKEKNSVLKDFASIKKAASDHFEKLYREEIGAEQNDNLLDAVPNLITPKMNQVLESKITHKETKEALFAMDPDKAPRLDGFTPRFLQTY